MADSSKPKPLDVVVRQTGEARTDVAESDLEEGPLVSDPKLLVLVCLLLIACMFVASVAADIILPLVMAFVLKLLFQPVMRLLGHLSIPRPLRALLVILAFFAVIVGIVAAVSGPATSWAAKLPQGLPRLQDRLHFLSQPIQALSNFMTQIGATSGKGVNLDVLPMLYNGTQHFAGGLFETFLILFFLLISGDTFLRRMVEILPRFSDKRQMVELSQQVERNISAYLVTITIMNLLVGLATGLVMWEIGLGDPVLWGVTAFMLNYIPIMGPVAGVGLFLFVGLLTVDELWRAFLPAALYLCVHLVEGEIVTPMLLARRFTLNPVLVILSLIFWFWMWGVPGAVLAVPMLAIIKIICDGVAPLNSIGHFLEG